MREFVACGNETNLRVYNIVDNKSTITIRNAHSDNIKRALFYNENCVISGSQDKTLKLWDLSNPKEPVSVIKLANSIEDFVLIKENVLAVANGNTISIVKIDEANIMTRQNDYVAFQKPIMRIRYDKLKDRIIAGGFDSHLKFLTIEENNTLKISYKIKVPSEIFAFDISGDNSHFGVGLNDGSLIIKSKQLDEIVEENEEEKLFKSLEPTF
jgi:WD40 repeat protein